MPRSPFPPLVFPSFTSPTPSPRRYCLGIDPGLSGALAVVSSLRDGTEGYQVEEVFDTPILETKSKAASGKNSVDTAYLFLRLKELKAKYTGLFSYLERVSAMPKQGVSSTFAFGEVFGATKQALTCSEIPWELVTPQSWKGRLRVPASPTQAIIARADQMLPGNAAVWRGPRGGLLDGRAEAALIAVYGLLASPNAITGLSG